PDRSKEMPVDARSGLSALGLPLYELRVGEVPCGDQPPPAVLVKQLKERPVRPSLRNAAVPAALEAISLRCLEKNPDQRFQTADEFAAALHDTAAPLSDAAGMATMPMARPPAASTASDPTLVSPARAAAVEPTLVTRAAKSAEPAAPPPVQPAAAPATQVAAPQAAAPPAAPVQAASKDTRPTVNVPQMQPAVAAGVPQPATNKSSMMP